MRKTRAIVALCVGTALCLAVLAGCGERLTALERMQKAAHERHEEFVKRNQEEAERSRQRMEEHGRKVRRSPS